MQRRTVARSAASAVGACALYGGWTLYANWAHGSAAALRSAAAQGLFSALLTFVLVVAMEAVHRRLHRRRFGAALTILICAGTCQGTTAAIHVAIGTPELLTTLAPTILIGGAFIVAYVLALHRAAALRTDSTDTDSSPRGGTAPRPP